MFGTARWRLTLWFAMAFGLIFLIIGAAVYLGTRAVLFDQVNGDLESRAVRELRALSARFGRLRGVIPPGIAIGPAFTTGGYFYALVTPEGELVISTPNADPAALAGEEALQKALDDGDTFVDTESSEGDSLRVYVVKLEGPNNQELLIEVGRSTEPERDALQRLLLVLAGGGGASVVLALVGGYLLAGRALKPIRIAMDS